MYLDLISDIKSILASIPACHVDGKLDPKIQEAVDVIERRIETCIAKDREVEIQYIKDMIDASLLNHTDRTILTMMGTSNGLFNITIDDVFGFKLHPSTDIKMLRNFVEYVFDTLGVTIVEPMLENIPTDSKTAEDEVTEAPTVVVEEPESVEIEEPAEEAIEEVVYLDPEEIEIKKKQNVEHLNNVRSNLNKLSDEARSVKLKERTDEIAHVISDNHTIVSIMKNGIKYVFNQLEGNEIFLSDILNRTKEKIGHVSNMNWLRALVKVEEINRKNKLEPTPRVIVDNNLATNTIASLDKKEVAYIVVCNLEFISNHHDVRGYSIFELITYMLDYCDKTSSLTITDTPEEIANLMSGVYEIFVSNNLNKDFVYNVSDDITTLGLVDNWHLKNNIVMSYLTDADFNTLSNYDDDVNKVVDICSKRDILMSTQTLDTNQTKQLYSVLDSINLTSTNNVIRKHDVENNTYVLIGKNIGTYKNICIVIDSMGVVSYMNQTDGRSFQKNYTPQYASDLIKWLDVLFPKYPTIVQPIGLVAAVPPTNELN